MMVHGPVICSSDHPRAFATDFQASTHNPLTWAFASISQTSARMPRRNSAPVSTIADTRPQDRNVDQEESWREVLKFHNARQPMSTATTFRSEPQAQVSHGA
ncbi:hypothetical protein [Nocardioides gansuensis]|uniref:hypothetical protein n=1 Tax=Nocardioides gansuensis TaxID=2138300 RepID=UPI0010579B05|nr:hypothetical protein [Nocardioides gansuensis]